MAYRKPKRYLLTPTRKHLGRAVARRSHKKIAYECFDDPAIRKHILRRIGQEIRKELINMSSEKVKSVMRMRSKVDLNTFTWKRLLDEASTHAPVFFYILSSATKTKIKRSNTQAVLGTCLAVLLKHRNQSMNLVQKIISLILHNGNASKQVCYR